MIWIATLIILGGGTFLAYAYQRKWFFLSVLDEEKYEREKPLFK
ncbi:hypothetical protein [Cerasicoccus arenae]|nr:hypothetical protein [Cerasicoccus arenae]